MLGAQTMPGTPARLLLQAMVCLGSTLEALAEAGLSAGDNDGNTVSSSISP